MATFTCQTARWVSTSPYVKLTITTTESATSVTFSYKLQYISDYGVASATAPKSYTLTIGGTEVKSGTCYIGGKQDYTILEGVKSYTKTKATQNIACSFTFGFELTWSGVYCVSKTASTYITIAAKNNYNVTYNANGGTGAPSAQTKWYDEPLNLSSANPTRTGYTFQGWGTSAADTTVDYKPGASYTANAETTLYAIWKANTYTVTYNANGGTGAPAAQTKTYGVNLTLTTSKPTRANYTFKGWATTATGAVAYQPGGLYTNNAAITLYAVWELSYVLPQIYNAKVEWVENKGSNAISIAFDWGTTNSDPTGNLAFNNASGTTVHSVSLGQLSGKSGHFESTISANEVNTDTSYVVKITLSDGGGDTTSTVTLTGNIYPIDFLAGGKGVSFGGPASLEDTAHFQWAARFDKAVYGNVPGMNKLPEIPANDDFNNYMTTGCWAVYRNDNAETIANIPVARAGRLEVWSSTGEGIRAEQWSYLRQRFIPYNDSNATWERDVSRGENNVWNFGDWYRSTLTPAASEKIYSKSALTIGRSSDFTIYMANAYQSVSLDKIICSYGDSIYYDISNITIGANVSTVKISGQLWIKCKDSTGIAGNRYAKIVITRSSGSIYHHAWSCSYANTGENVVISFPPTVCNVQEGDRISFATHTVDGNDKIIAGSSSNGYQTYLTVETL